MTGSFPLRFRRVGLSLCVLLAGNACTDLPTGAEAFQLEADGELWTAVLPPPDLPSAASWLTFAPATAESAETASAVGALQEEAARARAVGETDRANRLLEEAARRALGAMDAEPGPGILLRGIASLEAWERRVESEVDLTRAPGLAQAVREVARGREAAGESLRSGDRSGAALRLTLAGDVVRDWSPQGVLLRALDRVEIRLAAVEGLPEQNERARHLLESARQELRTGEPLRGVQRALYALQLAGGNGLEELPEPEHARCGEYAC